MLGLKTNTDCTKVDSGFHIPSDGLIIISSLNHIIEFVLMIHCLFIISKSKKRMLSCYRIFKYAISIFSSSKILYNVIFN